MSREALYVAMTRGREANLVYVATDAVDPGCDQLPDVHAARTGRQVLEQVLATSTAERSATQTFVQLQESSRSLKTLMPIRETLAADAEVRRWQSLLVECGLGAEQAERVLDSPTRGALFASLRRGEALGHSMPDVLKRLVATRTLEVGADAAGDLAALLRCRVDRWLETAHEPLARTPPHATSLANEGDAPDPVVTTLAQIDSLIARRVDALSGIDAQVPQTPDRATDHMAHRRQRTFGHAARQSGGAAHAIDERRPSR